MKFSLCIIGIILSSNLFSQTLISDSIWYGKDSSFRTYKVWLPKDYDKEKKYQTIYCLDASFLFHPIVSSVEIYADPDVGTLPPTIVVGLYFNERNDDMGIHWKDGSLSQNGYAFQDLIRSVLISTIEANYSVSAYRAIVGHSNSSTFIKSFLWEASPIFDAYLSMSEFEFPNSQSNFCNLTIPESRPINLTMITGNEDAPFRYESGLKHQSILDSCRPDNLRYEHIQLTTANHLTMVPQGIPVGLESIYAHYASPPPSSDSVRLPFDIQSAHAYVDSLVHFRSKKYGVQAEYKFEDLNLLYDLYIKDTDSVNISEATQKYAVMFQDSSEYFYEAQVLEEMGALHSAEQSYLKHLDYYPTPGIWSYKRIVWLYMNKLNDNQKALYWIKQGYDITSSLDLLKLLPKIAQNSRKIRKDCTRFLHTTLSSTPNAEASESIKEILNQIE
ncbi:MAG: hypothetical protein ACI865_000538 [Flavobacteriaceae bacterium]|jgi:hypothetical protein